MSFLVYQYILAGDNYQFTNEAIVDRVTEDYPASLTGADLERAMLEVECMVYTQDIVEARSHGRIVQELLAHDSHIRTASTNAAAATSAATAAEASASAAESSAAAAEAAQAAAEAVLASNRWVALSATSLSTISVASGSGTPTAIPWPSGSIRTAPFTDASGAWSLSSGNLHCSEPGVYMYTLSGSFTTGLLLGGGFRFAVQVGAESTTHPVQVALLGAEAGLSGSGVLVIPSGGAAVALKAGHTAPGATNLSLGELKMSMVKVS